MKSGLSDAPDYQTKLRAANLLREADHAIALTGAGISVESGVPAFRGKNALWDRYPVEEYATIEAFVRNPQKVWGFFKEFYEVLSRAEPNPAHVALKNLEEAGILKSIVTQNIDNLHQRAGSKNVVEFHGSASTLECLGCGSVVQFEERMLTGPAPTCGCGGLLKPQIVLFGEAIPFSALEAARHESLLCDLMLVIGTSAQVAPASMLPLFAKQRGAMIVEMNVEQTHLTGYVADLSVFGSLGLTLPEVAHLVSGDYIDTPPVR